MLSVYLHVCYVKSYIVLFTYLVSLAFTSSVSLVMVYCHWFFRTIEMVHLNLICINYFRFTLLFIGISLLLLHSAPVDLNIVVVVQMKTLNERSQ